MDGRMSAQQLPKRLTLHTPYYYHLLSRVAQLYDLRHGMHYRSIKDRQETHEIAHEKGQYSTIFISYLLILKQIRLKQIVYILILYITNKTCTGIICN